MQKCKNNDRRGILKMRANFKPFVLIFATFLLLLILTDSQVQSSPVPDGSKLLRRFPCCEDCLDADAGDDTSDRNNICLRNCKSCGRNVI